jgi:multiple sugar transport system substrate-binding protein
MEEHMSTPKKLNRRDFLKGAGILSGTLAATALTGCGAPAATPAPAAPAAAAATAVPAAPAAAVTAATTAPAAAAATAVPAVSSGATVAKVDPITILINDSPWYPGFEKLVKLYQDKTGNQVKLAVTPFTGMAEKTRNAVTASESEYDIVNLNEGWYATYYAGKFMTPLQEIDPNFKLDPNIINYNYATHWNHTKNYSAADGIMYGLPINGNIQLLYYRTDMYEKAGLKVPETWEDVAAASTKLMSPPNMYGFCTRGQKAGFAVAYDWLPFLRGYNGDWVAKPGEDWTVTINNAAGKKAMAKWLEMQKTYGPPNVADLGQAEVQQLMLAGKLVHALMVVANWSAMDNPEKSTVVNKVNVIPLPKPAEGRHATTTGIWVMSIPKNMVDKRKKAALTFLQWALTKESQIEYTKFGAVPVRQDVYTSELASDPKYRWMKAMGDSTQYIVESIRIPEGPQITDSMELHLNEAVAGLKTGDEALKLMANEILAVLQKAGYKTSMAS